MLEQTVKRMFSHMSAGERWNLKTGYSAGPGSPVKRKLLIYVNYDGLKGLQGFEISRYSATKGEKPDPICLSAILGKIDEKSGNPPQAFQLNAVEQNTFLPTSL